MKTFTFIAGSILPKDPGVTLGDHVILVNDNGHELADCIVVKDAEKSNDCPPDCLCKSNKLSMCVRFDTTNGVHPCVLCGCYGHYEQAPGLEDL